MLTVTIDQSEGISGADIPEQAVKKMRTGSAALSLPSPRAFFLFLLLNDFPPPSRSLEQAMIQGQVVNENRQVNNLPCVILESLKRFY